MYKLYTAPTPNGWKVAMALEELKAQYEIQLIDLQSGEQHSNWFLQINPNGRIPVLKTMGKDNTWGCCSWLLLVCLCFRLFF